MHNNTRMAKNNENIIKTICISAPIICSCKQKIIYTLSVISQSFQEYLYTLVKQNLICDFFVFSESIASFSANISPSQTGLNKKPFCFCPDVNTKRIFGAEQPIRLREKHYPPLFLFLV